MTDSHPAFEAADALLGEGSFELATYEALLAAVVVPPLPNTGPPTEAGKAVLAAVSLTNNACDSFAALI